MITRSQIRRQLRKGGIASLPRQGYFLGDIVGGIGDVLGGAAKKVKEIVKSDAGKAALAIAAMYAGGKAGMFGKGIQQQGWKNFLLGTPGIAEQGGTMGKLGEWGLTKGFSGGLTGLGMGAAAGAGTALMAGAPKPPKDQLDLMKQRGEDLEPYLRDWYKKYYTANWQEGWTQEGEDEFVRVNTSEYKAKGGRIGYGLGDLVGLGEKTGVVHPNPDKVATGNGFMGSLIPRAIDSGILSIPQSPENKLQQAYAVYVASGGDLEYEEWKADRMMAAQGGRIGYARGPVLPEDISELGAEPSLDELIQEEGIPIGEQVKGPLLPELEEEDIMEFMQDQGIQTKELEAGAADIKVTGDVTPNVEKFIEEKWIERGGQWGDLIPKWFRDEIIKYYNLKASAPHPDENWMGLWEDLRGKGEVPESIRNLQEFKNWFQNQDFDIDMSQVDTGIMQASKGGRAGMQKGGRGLLSLSHLPWLKLLEEDEEELNKGGRVGLQGGASIDPRMRQSLRENTALNDARRAVNEALSGTGGEGAIDRLYERFHVGNPRMFSPGTNPRPGQTYHSISDRAALERELSGKILGGGYKGTAEYERQQQAARDRIAAKEQAKAEAEAKRIEAAITGAYGKPEDYEFQAQLLGMNPQAYYDYLATGDPKGVTGSGMGAWHTPYNVWYDQQLANQPPGLPESQKIQYGQVPRGGGIGMLTAGQPPSMYSPYTDAVTSQKQEWDVHYPTKTYQSTYAAPDPSTWDPYQKWKAGIPFNKGGRIGKFGGGLGGLPGIPRMAADGLEYDMRGGGFQNLGAKEGKDDVKANLAKNEFVMTADAVRGAGGGDIEVGAQRMYDTMKKLERKIA